VTAQEPLILLIEDEPQMRRFLRAALSARGLRLLEAATGEEGLRLVSARGPDVVLLDLGLPDLDGVEVTHRLREWSETPIIVLSARGEEADKVTALDAGADDYLTKPFAVEELLARMRVAMRHAWRLGSQPEPAELTVGPIRVDLTRRLVYADEGEVHLTPTEYRLLTTLLRYRGRVVTQRHLLKEVWGLAHLNQTQYLRVYMAQLRRKLEPDPARPRHLLTEPGVGYRLREE
jgi:two-component system KDP operon response regulator KdpE